MNDSELIKEFIGIEKDNDWTRIMVQQIEWEGPHTPILSSTIARKLPKDASDEEVQRAIQDVLDDEKYFRICAECLERKPVGWMMESYCQSCGERNHGVVF